MVKTWALTKPGSPDNLAALARLAFWCQGIGAELSSVGNFLAVWLGMIHVDRHTVSKTHEVP